MVLLRADPWRPDLGAGAEAPFDDDLRRPVVDPTVETDDWSEPIVPAPAADERVTFVDGVMRTELRVLASDGDRRGWGLLGSYAAGAVRCNDTAVFVAEDEPIGRALIVGGRIAPEPLTLAFGDARLTYEPRSIAADDPISLRRALQRLMLKAEQRLAADLAADGLVFADGPLHLNAGAGVEVVGVVKRMSVAYLQDEHAELLTELEPGQRSPLFALGDQLVDRYGWYIRLIPRHPTWHELAGLVRCDVRMEIGLDAAPGLADRVAGLLPRYAGRIGVDPRAPQNLTPVGALEARLKHRLGHAGVIRRALQQSLSEDANV